MLETLPTHPPKIIDNLTIGILNFAEALATDYGVFAKFTATNVGLQAQLYKVQAQNTDLQHQLLYAHHQLAAQQQQYHQTHNLLQPLPVQYFSSP